MMLSKPFRFVVSTYLLLTANADTNTVRGVQQRGLVATTKVNLGKAGDYAILTKAGISTVPDSTIKGDIAVSPIAATAMTGFSLVANPVAEGKYTTSTQFTGKAYGASYIEPTPTHLTTAVSDMETAYTDAAGRLNPIAAKTNIGSGAIGGEKLTSDSTDGGVYTFGSDVTINSDVTFEGSATDIFIIQMTGNLIMADAVKVTLVGGVLAENIFWQVSGKVEVGTGSHLEGILLVKTSVLFKTGSSLNGRILAQTACDLQEATITQPEN
eukprot:CAMPEP_0201622038 /NCGR_PEP_ID=MMETSP0492-20130828/47186_1 /ASSEMBLY_ACC=CAM_ASM_000837 /TAXON_ID=420259 /ORGANISM="Thalassiosira gravida, Strain GMp14c1" /LENGTH=268 /DNA_ID=CAMNT_0048091611 /DNA_START=1196 /DNA_END=2002 /DNA_ORIENTATION=+